VLNKAKPGNRQDQTGTLFAKIDYGLIDDLPLRLDAQLRSFWLMQYGLKWL
jgi:hypothetical protein